MKLALMSKAMLCVCPPALIATSVVTVPPVRRAVHRLTQPHHAPAKRIHRRARPHVAQAAAPCGGGGAVDRPAVPFLTYAEPGPADTGFSSSELPLGGGGGAGASPESFGPGPVFVGGPGTPGLSGPNPGVTVDTPGAPATPTPGDTPTPTPTTPVPEPSIWAMMILGVGLAGVSLRRNRRDAQPKRRGVGKPRTRVRPVSGWGRMAKRFGLASAFADGALLPAMDPVNAGAVVSANTAKSAMLAKVLMCVCPPAIIATSVATVPPVRKAVYTATAPRTNTVVKPRTAAAVPCDPALAEVTAPRAVAQAGGV